MLGTLGELDVVLEDMIRWSRPSSPSMRLVAINFGYRECCRAITQLRPEHFLQEVVITLPANLYRVPLNNPDYHLRPIQRIKMIQVFDAGSPPLTPEVSAASSSSVRFQYASVESDRFQVSQSGGSSATDIVYYDLLYPLTFADNMMRPVATLALAPALAQETKVVLETIYFPIDLTVADDVMELIVTRHYETVIAFAMYWLLQTVNDIEARAWQAQGMGGLMVLRDAVAQVSGQNTEFLDSGLVFGDE